MIKYNAVKNEMLGFDQHMQRTQSAGAEGYYITKVVCDTKVGDGIPCCDVDECELFAVYNSNTTLDARQFYRDVGWLDVGADESYALCALISDTLHVVAMFDAEVDAYE